MAAVKLARVSIVTPSLNQGAYLERAMRSVLDQGYLDLEYIVMDGGSSDDSAEILRRYEDKLAYWESKADRGQSHALNKGFRRATGDILGWLNADDEYCPGAIVQALALLDRHPEVAGVYTDAELIDQDGNPTGVMRAGRADPARLLAGDACVPCQAAFFRRSAVEAVGLVDETLHLIMDQELCVRLSWHYPLLYVPDAVWARIRVHPGAKTSRDAAGLARELREIAERTLGRPDCLPQVKARRRQIRARVSYYALISRAFGHDLPGLIGLAVRSLAHDPRFLLSRPRHAAYLAKTALLGAVAPGGRS